jgi:hypothetical protein
MRKREKRQRVHGPSERKRDGEGRGGGKTRFFFQMVYMINNVDIWHRSGYL